MRRLITISIAVLIGSLAAQAEMQAGPYSITVVTDNAGGQLSAAGDYTLNASTGQTVGVGSLLYSPYGFDDGFWQAAMQSAPPQIGIPAQLSVCPDSACPAQANTITVAATDADSDTATLVWTVQVAPGMGSVSFVGSNTGESVQLCYAPNGGQSGNDSFELQVRDGSGNTDQRSVQVVIGAPAAPGQIQAIPAAVCIGAPATLSAQVDSNATVDWFDDSSGQMLVGSGASLQVIPAATTTYYARTRDLVTGCVSVISASGATVSVDPLPSEAVVGAGQTICAGCTTNGLGGNAPVAGSGEWSIVEGGTGTFSPDATAPNATFTHTSGAGPVLLRWTISSNPCAPSSADVTVTIDDVPPDLVAVSPSDQEHVYAVVSAVQVTFGEPINHLTAGDLTVNGSAATNLSGTGAGPYTFSGFAAPADGPVEFSLSDAAVVDQVGNRFAGATWIAYQDTNNQGPTLLARSPAIGAFVQELTQVTVTFTESVTGVQAGLLTVNGSPATEVTGSLAGPYTFAGFVAPLDGTVSIVLEADAIVDLAMNPYPGDTWSCVKDSVAPTVTSIGLSDPDPTDAATVHFLVTFDEAVNGVTSDNFLLTVTGQENAAILDVSGTGNARVVSVSTDVGEGTIRLDFANSNVVADQANNAVANVPFTAGAYYTLDRSGPTDLALSFSSVTTDAITVTASAFDAIAGISSASGYRFSLDGQADSAWTGSSHTWTGLTPNTLYDGFVVTVRDRTQPTPNESSSLPASQWTLSIPPSGATIQVDKAGPCPGEAVTWTAVGGFGAGRVTYYRYAWDQLATHVWTSDEPVWSSGALQTTPTSTGVWYLHLQGCNQGHVANGELHTSVTALSNTTILTSPNSVNAVAGSSVQFSVSAQGTGTLTYRWQRGSDAAWSDLSDGGGVAGAETATLMLVGVNHADEGQYRCVVTADCGSVESTAAQLTIAPEVAHWYSVKNHGPAGDLAIELNSTRTGSGANSPFVEPRRGDLRLRIAFTDPLQATSGSLTVSDVAVIDSEDHPIVPASISLVDGGGALELVVPESEANTRRLTVQLLPGRLCRAGEARALLLGDRDCQIRCLIGDLNASGVVNTSDMSIARFAASTPMPLDETTCIYDVNTSGAITVVDMSMVKNMIGETVP